MFIFKPVKLLIGLLSAGGIIGGAIGGYYELSKSKIKDRLKDTLIKASEIEKWNARIAKLGNTDDSKLTSKLIEIKKNAKSDEIIRWCSENSEKRFSHDSDPTFLAVQNFCTYNIKDKISNLVPEDGWSNNKNNDKLKAVKDNTKISQALINIKSELETNSNALKNWCTRTYEKQFKGIKDPEFLEVEEYCQIIS